MLALFIAFEKSMVMLGFKGKPLKVVLASIPLIFIELTEKKVVGASGSFGSSLVLHAAIPSIRTKKKKYFRNIMRIE